MLLRLYTAQHHYMLNKEIFIKSNRPPSFHCVDKDCLIYFLHPDFTITVCHETYTVSLLHLLIVYSSFVFLSLPLRHQVVWDRYMGVIKSCIFKMYHD